MNTQTIELNHATADDLLEAHIEGLEEKHVNDLLEYRNQYGPFESWEDLNEILGFTQELIDRMQLSGVMLGTDEAYFADAEADGLNG